MLESLGVPLPAEFLLQSRLEFRRVLLRQQEIDIGREAHVAVMADGHRPDDDRGHTGLPIEALKLGQPLSP